ncbi:MAG: Gx transporter family protein [Oliverpabstia sp.]
MSRKVAYSAILAALAMIFSYVETLIPVNFGIPGIKLGLANLVVVVGLYFLPPGQVLMISLTRILLIGFLFGNGMSILYSLAGGILSFIVMLLLKKIKGFSIIGVSVAGGVAHNVGQILVAACVVENLKLFYYFPALLVSGTITGILIGIVSNRVLPVVQREGKTKVIFFD